MIKILGGGGGGVHLLRAEKKAFSIFLLQDQFFGKQSWSKTGAFPFLNCGMRTTAYLKRVRAGWPSLVCRSREPSRAELSAGCSASDSNTRANGAGQQLPRRIGKL